ncbi:MAG: SAM-dependent methyltransferase [Bacteroidales bacterium]|jgi:16S rRNA (cytidine1402-2'-O)-methyltransferase|nr:SAM-dependent methyltransferase [Bacteroidales bacterium]
MTKGKLFLIPAPLGEIDFSVIFPNFNAQIIQDIDYFIVEELRTGRRFIKKLGMKKPIESLDIQLLNEHSKPKDCDHYLQPCLKGHHVGLLSEAGTPCVADPGNIIVAYAHKLGIEIVPLIGPNSILLALMGSGFNGQNFAFNGYLCRDRKDREKELRFYESILMKSGQTQIFIETPYRNNHFFQSMLAVCKPHLKVCLATNLASDQQSIRTKTIEDWKKETVDIHKQPTVFLLGN